MSKILIIEDEEAIADLEKDYLELSGFEVEIANRGDVGLEKALKEEYDLIILDIMMPGMDGYEATRAIRLSEKIDAADIPIIALTANAFAEDAKAAHDAGMNAHLSKPLDFNKLKNILARIKKNGSVSL